MKKNIIGGLILTALLSACSGQETSVNRQIGEAADTIKQQGLPESVVFQAQPVPDGIAAKIKESLAKQITDSGVEILGIYTTPSPDLFEIVMNGNQILYVTKDAKFVLAGALLDVHQNKNITAERVAELSRIKFDELPFDLAVKTVYGNGKHSIAVFSDPDCPYCKQLERELAKTDLTVYTFMFPLEELHPGATDKARRIMCEKDPAAAWKAWMLEGKAPTAQADCENAAKVEQAFKYGIARQINGTPTIVFSNGFRQSGVAQAEMIGAMAAEAAGEKPQLPAAQAASGPDMKEFDAMIEEAASGAGK